MRRAQRLEQRRRRRLGGIPPIRDDDQVSAPDRVKIIRSLAGEAAAGQRRGWLITMIAMAM
jgi:hypothetical protein